MRAGDRGDEPIAGMALGELIEQVGARRPAPGGGTSAAVACALAAALAEMTAGFTLAADRHEDADEAMRSVRARAAALRRSALELGERDLHAYAPVLAAQRLPAGEPGRGERIRAALAEAAETPMAIARTAAEAAELAGEATAGGNPHLRGDGTAGVLLAEAACRAAAMLVALNLEQLPGDPRLEEITQLVERGDVARRRVLEKS